MNITDALSAIRSLDALAEARRRHLCALTATALTDAERSRIVAMAQRENIDTRWATEQALKAELAERARDPNLLLPCERPHCAYVLADR